MNSSAKALHESIKEKAMLQVSKTSSMMECPTCKGSGQLPVNIFHIDSKGLNRQTISKCTSCKRGKISTYDYYYQKFLRCDCKSSATFTLVEDGKDVFGQDIWLCSICELVKHFGL